MYSEGVRAEGRAERILKEVQALDRLVEARKAVQGAEEKFRTTPTQVAELELQSAKRLESEAQEAIDAIKEEVNAFLRAQRAAPTPEEINTARERASKYLGIEPYTPADDEEHIQILVTSRLIDDEVLRSQIVRDRKAVTTLVTDFPILRDETGKGHPRYPHLVQLKTRLRRYEGALVERKRRENTAAPILTKEQREQRNQKIWEEYKVETGVRTPYQVYTARNRPAGPKEFKQFLSGDLPDVTPKTGKPSETAKRIREFLELRTRPIPANKSRQ